MTILALHKDQFNLKQELKAQKAFFEHQIKVAREELPPIQLDLKYQVNPKNEKETKSQKILDFLRKSVFDVITARATVTFMLEEYVPMEGHASNAAQISSSLIETKHYEQCRYIRGVALYHQNRLSEADEAFHQAINCKGVNGISNKSAGRWMRDIQRVIADTPSQTPLQTPTTTSFPNSFPPRPVICGHPSNEDDTTPQYLPNNAAEQATASSMTEATTSSGPPSSALPFSDTGDHITVRNFTGTSPDQVIASSTIGSATFSHPSSPDLIPPHSDAETSFRSSPEPEDRFQVSQLPSTWVSRLPWLSIFSFPTAFIFPGQCSAHYLKHCSKPCSRHCF